MAFALRVTEKVSSVNEDEELKKRGYHVGATLGEGSYAKVKSAFSERFNRKVALKIINRRKAPKDFQQKFLPRELEVMKLLRHPHVTQLFEVMQFNGKVYIAMEMAGHGDLLEYIKLRGALPEERARNMFAQLISAVEYLHSIDIIHRDLKCENILLDTQNNIKVSDFGFARVLRSGDMSKTFCGSAAYAAPEILQGIPYTGHAYDIWSVGVILYIMVCGSMPYDDSNIKKMIKYQTERKVGFSRSKKVSDECKALIHRLLECNVSLRATIPEIYACPWMKQPLTPSVPATVPQSTSGPEQVPAGQTPHPEQGASGGTTSTSYKQQQQQPTVTAAPGAEGTHNCPPANASCEGQKASTASATKPNSGKGMKLWLGADSQDVPPQDIQAHQKALPPDVLQKHPAEPERPANSQGDCNGP